MAIDRRFPLALILALAAQAALAATPPTQPDKGAGGAEYRLPASEITKIAYGRDAGQVFVFRPASRP